MDIKNLIKLLEQVLNESPVQKKYSGEPLFDSPKDIDTIIDKCYELYKTNTDGNGYNEVLDLTLSRQIPFLKTKLESPIHIVYGNSNLGIRHILENRAKEFTDKNIGLRMSEQAILKALKQLPQALKSGAVLVDFDLKGDNKKKKSVRKNSIPLPLTDRIILDYDDIYYIVLLQGRDGLSDMTCPLTLFKPTREYRSRIEQLSVLYK